jgi:hypothetical protein
VTVFEASNDTLREYYVFMSTSPLIEVIRGHCERPPKKIAHWRRGHSIYYIEVEILPDEETAWEFLERYVGTLERTGWTVLV